MISDKWQKSTSVVSMHRVCKKDLGTYSYKLQKFQMLSEVTKQKIVQRAKGLLKRQKDITLKNLIFSNEKIFTVKAAFNHENDRVLSKSLLAIPEGIKKVCTPQKPPSLMLQSAKIDYNVVRGNSKAFTSCTSKKQYQRKQN